MVSGYDGGKGVENNETATKSKKGGGQKHLCATNCLDQVMLIRVGTEDTTRTGLQRNTGNTSQDLYFVEGGVLVPIPICVI